MFYVAEYLPNTHNQWIGVGTRTQPRPLFRLFLVFSDKQYIFYNKSMWKNVMSIQYTVPAFNPRPLKHESPPITTRPGLPP